MITREIFEEYKDDLVWVLFCHANQLIRGAINREGSRVEHGPVLVRLGDVIKMEGDFHDEGRGVDNPGYMHVYATQGYPEIETVNAEAISELNKMGYETYQVQAYPYPSDVTYVKPKDEPAITGFEAPLLELWIGEGNEVGTPKRNETLDLGTYVGDAYSQEQLDMASQDVEATKQRMFASVEKYEKMKNQNVWVSFCSLDESVEKARDREHSMIIYPPVLIKLGDAIIDEREGNAFGEYDIEEGVDSFRFKHHFATPYPKIDKCQKATIAELKKRGYQLYEENSVSREYSFVVPLGDPAEKVNAQHYKVWFGESAGNAAHRCKDMGMYEGKMYTKEQIEQVEQDIEDIMKNLNSREVVSEPRNQGNYDSIATTLGVKEGEIVWRRQGDELAVVIKDDEGSLSLCKAFEFPTFSADNKDLKAELEKLGTVELEHCGNSGFAKRNFYIVRPIEKSTEYNIKEIMQYGTGRETRYMTMRDNKETMDYCVDDVKKAQEAIEQAKENMMAQRKERFTRKFNERSIEGVFSIVSEGGKEEKVEVPEERFIECFRYTTAYTQDHRQGLTHTEDVAYIDAEMAKKSLKNGSLDISIPEKYMSMMIGKQGRNIKQLQEKLARMAGIPSVRINLHSLSKEEEKIGLTQIADALKNRGMGNPGDGDIN